MDLVIICDHSTYYHNIDVIENIIWYELYIWIMIMASTGMDLVIICDHRTYYHNIDMIENIIWYELYICLIWIIYLNQDYGLNQDGLGDNKRS